MIVVGGGVIGCATAAHLARSGVRVTLIESRAIGHDAGSSHGPSRIIRLTYQSADYIALARASFAAWAVLERRSNAALVVPCGGLDFGPPDANNAPEMIAAMRTCGVPFDLVDRDEIVARFPQLRPPDGAAGFYQPDYAMLAADRCVAALAAVARAGGADLREGEAVRSIAPDGAGVVVTTDRGELRGDAAVVANGSWVGSLVAPLGIDLRLTVLREQLAFFEPIDPASFMPGRMPLFIQRFAGTTTLGSGFPTLGSPAGVKIMIDRLGPAVEPDDPDRTIDRALLARLERYATGTVRGLSGRVIAAVSCRYAMTPDEDFVLAPHPEHRQIVIASACSGHGFKFAPVIGEILGDLATTGSTRHPIGRFRLERPGLERTWENAHV